MSYEDAIINYAQNLNYSIQIFICLIFLAVVLVIFTIAHALTGKKVFKALLVLFALQIIVVIVVGSGVDDRREKAAKVIVNDCYYQNIKKTSTWSYDTDTKEYVIDGKTYAVDKVQTLKHTPTLKSPKLTLYEGRLKPKVQKNQYETIANAIEDVNGQMNGKKSAKTIINKFLKSKSKIVIHE